MLYKYTVNILEDSNEPYQNIGFMLEKELQTLEKTGQETKETELAQQAYQAHDSLYQSVHYLAAFSDTVIRHTSLYQGILDCVRILLSTHYTSFSQIDHTKVLLEELQKVINSKGVAEYKSSLDSLQSIINGVDNCLECYRKHIEFKKPGCF